MYRYLSFQTVNLSFQTINSSFYVVLLLILDSKNDNNSNKFIVFYHFSCKNPTQNNKFIILYRFASIKLPQHEIPKTNYRLNEALIFLLLCCAVSYRWLKTLLPQTFASKANQLLDNSEIVNCFYVATRNTSF